MDNRHAKGFQERIASTADGCLNLRLHGVASPLILFGHGMANVTA
jgi:hypothetical protein